MMYCECGAEVTEDFDCPKCRPRAWAGTKFADVEKYRIFVQIPCSQATDFTAPEFRSKESTLEQIVKQPLGDRGTGMFSFDPESTDEDKKLSRDYWFVVGSIDEAKRIKTEIEQAGWVATIREF
jgi:hypothetical protein